MQLFENLEFKSKKIIPMAKTGRKKALPDKENSKPPVSAPAEEQELFPELKKAWKEVRWVGFFVFLFVSIPSMAVSTLITRALSPELMSAEMGQSLLDVAFKTAPLTLAVILITFAHLRDWADFGWGSVLLSIAVLVGTTLLLNVEGYEMIKTAWQNSTGNVLITFLINLLLGYLQMYFWWPFVSSLVVGMFGGWATNRLISAVE
ncbi:hypothetical protein C7N43_26195 [Sphingobacteriales bacterium UPWRP_1]|nr:hypothetical protein B6N25_16125 [Sphingobacteriales bacterium TSM_CSS]PSJ74019.1 hypothetical protein C7N43_26195 [Sphingobacteriales bacterium UPWRP_1]